MKPSNLATITTAAFLLLTPLAAPAMRAQSADTGWEKAAGGKMSFDVVSVKRNTSGMAANGDQPHSNVPLDESDRDPSTGGLLSIVNMPASNFIMFAYKLDYSQTQSMTAKLPKWAQAENFNIEARGPANATKDQMRLMMQSLLADRFKLTAHFEVRVVPVYELVLAQPGKTGPQLTPYSDAHPCVDPDHPQSGAANPAAPPIVCGLLLANNMPGGGFRVSSGRVTIQKIADDLSTLPPANLDRPIVDRTGLTGAYDFTIDLPRGMPGMPGARGDNSTDDPSIPSFPSLLRDQLGLKLQAATAPITYLVVDHIEEPTAN